MKNTDEQPKLCPICHGAKRGSLGTCVACGGEGISSVRTDAHMTRLYNGIAQCARAMQAEQAEKKRQVAVAQIQKAA